MNEEWKRIRRKKFLEKRKKAWAKVMANHPEGLTKKNLDQIKEEMKKEEGNG